MKVKNFKKPHKIGGEMGGNYCGFRISDCGFEKGFHHEGDEENEGLKGNRKGWEIGAKD
jgi:hypothetical protein